MIYLDHAASTSLRPEAIAAAELVWQDAPANPTGAHSRAQAVRGYLELARERLAGMCDVRPNDVVFTSGGTESDNWAIRAGASRGAVLYSGVEHPAVREPASACEGMAIRVDSDGVVDLDHLEKLLRGGPPVGVVSVMSANNETGVIQPLGEISRLIADVSPNTFLHSDAVQSFTKLPLDVGDTGVQAAAVSAHKLGGPIGTGAMITTESLDLEPLLVGGGQERGLRAGTPDPAGAYAFAAAADAAVACDWAPIAGLRDRLEAALLDAIPGLVVYGAGAERLPTHCQVGIEGLPADMAVIACDRAGLAISSGSSCASGATAPSGALAAMGVSGEGSLRFSLGWTTTAADIDSALDIVVDVVASLRAKPVGDVAATGGDEVRR